MSESDKVYKLKRQKGIDDLLCEYAWIGNSQGDTSATNSIKEGEGSNGWMSFIFHGINSRDQEAINRESARRKKANEDYIAELKAKGEYGKEYELEIHLKPNLIFDNNYPSSRPIESFKMMFIDETGKLIEFKKHE